MPHTLTSLIELRIAPRQLRKDCSKHPSIIKAFENRFLDDVSTIEVSAVVNDCTTKRKKLEHPNFLIALANCKSLASGELTLLMSLIMNLARPKIKFIHMAIDLMALIQVFDEFR